MANSVKGEVPLALSDGRELVLCMDFAMRCAVEDLCNKPYGEVVADSNRGFNRSIRAIMWGALQRHHPEMTLDDVSELVDSHAEDLERAMGHAAKAAASTGGKEGANPRPRRPGKTSGANGAKPA